MKTLVLFDFDGTITKEDTLLVMARMSTNRLAYWLKMVILSPALIAMKFKIISNHKGKELFLNMFFGKMSLEKFSSLCFQFANDILVGILRDEAIQEIENHQKAKSEVYVVSASPENWIKPWTDKLGLNLLATKLEVVNNRVTGRIYGANCNGVEKVNRIKEVVTLEEYDQIIAYGDSLGDIPMLNLANQKYYKPFR